MPTIAHGVKLVIVKDDGTVVESIDIGGYNLQKQFARAELVQEIIDSLTPSCYQSWVVVDEEATGEARILGTFGSEREAARFIDAQPDREKILRGGYGIDGPSEE